MKSIGTLRYSPKLLGDHISERWWTVLDCDESIGAYFRCLYSMHHYKARTLVKPAWDSHITVIRNELPPRQDLWEKYSGKLIEFEYEFEHHTDGNYWWVNVMCPELIAIRVELGLSADPLLPLHLSTGHQGLTST